MLDGKNGYGAYLWNNTASFDENCAGGKKYTHTLTNQTEGTKSSLTCKFIDDGGCCVTQYINYTVGNVCGVVSIGDAIENKVLLYPNPAKDVLQISADRPVKAIIISNLFGNKIVVANLDNAGGTISIGRIADGNYMVIVRLENGTSLSVIS
jgi:hypothetical protein